MYYWSYGKPLPQIIIELSDGTKQKFCGKTKLAKFVRKTDKKLPSKNTLKHFLDNIKIRIDWDTAKSLLILGQND